ncbi:hypothetical protein PFICI_08177 [Pestalotiopsis fici W106-1]|uniref:LPXTG-motif cell wall anchor domain protein n=1 Tax=Pestalotiopsis fici (strain W106-1 / CGMCC3.15140) TaxID=1229662 RepID=W3X3D7_PESFW|nr:uncharacterized protein PFICI_08177 [Pestalotiopsis fici W106-1]ETS80648.1 hypothetical protein PFICI_08177 [Pestalotiopsis fici W106-1]
MADTTPTTTTTTSDGAATTALTTNTTTTTATTTTDGPVPRQRSSIDFSSSTAVASSHPDEKHKINTTTTGSKTNNNFHAHRQSHNPSKLPTFRFADLRKQSLAHPSLLTQSQGIPPSPVSPRTDPTRQDSDLPAAAKSQQQQPPKTAQQSNIPASTRRGSPQGHRQRTSIRRGPVSPGPLSPTSIASLQHVVASSSASSDTSSGRSRTATLLSPRKSASVSATRPVNSRRPISLGSSFSPSKTSDSPSASDSATTIVLAQPQQPRASSSSRRASASEPHPPPAGSPEESLENATVESTLGQKELSNSVQKTSTHAKKGSIAARRPPVSYSRRSAAPAPAKVTKGASTKIPPIRSFRTSGDRQTLGIDTNLYSPTKHDDQTGDSDHHDRTLKALEGRQDDGNYGMTPPDSALEQHDADDSGDVFLNMAREEPDPQPTPSRVIRSAHRRPLSSAIPPYQPMSPTQASRRMSDLESARSKSREEGQLAERPARALTFRSSLTGGNTSEIKNSNSKASPITPRTLTFQEPLTESTSSSYGRRRQSNADSTSAALPSRMSSLKQPVGSTYSSSRTYNSSPLAPKLMDTQKPDAQVGDHQTESSNSTAAPSTVWDEIDDIRSRIQRLELTGKLPPTSGAAMSRASEERPPTATTNATTMSASPKRNGGDPTPQTDAVSVVSSSYGNKECPPLLQSAMNKSKALLPPEIYNALEGAASDAITLTAMIGRIGEPGPISSAASSVGGTAITDRQLRRKAESICRNLTELCLALSENVPQAKLPQDVPMPSLETGLAGSPMISRFSGGAASRRSSTILTDRSPVTAAVSSPRAMSRLEERRSSMLFSSAVPSPSSRYSSQTPVTPTEIAGRRTSLLVPRSRRAGTEEPEEAGSGISGISGHGRKSSLLLRTRRGGTEEAEEQAGRRSSLLRTRRTVYDEEDDRSPRIRSVSRTATDFTGPRPPVAQEFNPQIPMASIESASLSASPMQRRRLGLSSINTRIQPTTNSSLATRRYMDRTTPDYESSNLAEKLAEERGQRSFSGPQSSGLPSRNSSLQRRLRESVLTSSTATGQAAGYR